MPVTNSNNRKKRLPALPVLLKRKIYKTGQTRGADDDEIYQNRVLRNNTVLIPFSVWATKFIFPTEDKFENGYIVLIPPEDYFKINNADEFFKKYNLKLGENSLVFYETREQWQKNSPEKIKWIPAKNRSAPLEGQYLARIPATTSATNGKKIIKGFDATNKKGAGIRVYEYANKSTIESCSLQLEALFWHCFDSSTIAVKYGMTAKDTQTRKTSIIESAKQNGLLDYKVLFHSRVIDENHTTICPLCLQKLSSEGFFDKMKQATGREVLDLTVTELNLFHINELKINEYNHRPYNIGWGHHHCNVVVKDSGINETINWMQTILETNENRKKGSVEMLI